LKTDRVVTGLRPVWHHRRTLARARSGKGPASAVS